ncbi:MAG TPA: hypothetical protein VIV66_09950, partial [Pyrinomonadaceae bacterium]
MLRRTLTILSLTIVLVFAVEPMRSVQGVVMTKAESLMVSMTYVAGSQTEGSQGGNGIVRILKAPFKALGRLFGRGKKNEVKLERLNEKDVEKFEATSTVRVNDATSSPT